MPRRAHAPPGSAAHHRLIERPAAPVSNSAHETEHETMGDIQSDKGYVEVAFAIVNKQQADEQRSELPNSLIVHKIYEEPPGCMINMHLIPTLDKRHDTTSM